VHLIIQSPIQVQNHPHRINYSRNAFLQEESTSSIYPDPPPFIFLWRERASSLSIYLSPLSSVKITFDVESDKDWSDDDDDDDDDGRWG
jgi:hypothetical protein